jgi:small GTP-binding protein
VTDQPSTTEQSKPVVLEGFIAELREREIRLLSDAADQVSKIQPDGEADRQRLLDAAGDLREMFLLVTIIGEFNAGKTTFVNALLGEPLLPMGILPTTDMIEVIRFAPARGLAPEIKSDSVREWQHPNTGSAGVAIIDTPGTGSVFQKHEEIAKSFLHRSDLVIFVISAKRAFADTERLYLETAKNFGKKIVIVINQADLLDERERRDVRKFVKSQVDQLLGLQPPIFMVSAKMALQEGKATPLASMATPTTSEGEISLLPANRYGFVPLMSYLHNVFEQVPPAKQKLQTRLELLKSIIARHQATIKSRASLIGQDADAASNLQQEINRQAETLDKQMKDTLNQVNNVLAEVRKRGGYFLERHIKVAQGAFRGVDKEALRKEFESDVMGDAMTRLNAAQESYINALVDGSRAYWRSVLTRLGKLDAILREESVGMDAGAYADQRAALQAAMTLADIEMRAYSDQKLIEDIQEDFDQNVRNFIYGAVGSVGGAAAVLISIIGGAAVPGAAFPPLAVLGLIVGVPVALGGGLIANQARRKGVHNAQEQLEKRLQGIEDRYKEALSKITAQERNRLIQYGHQILGPVFSQLEALGARYKEQQQGLERFATYADDINKDLGRA